MTERERPLGAVFVAGLFVALAAWSFGKWTDPLIDFGFELYVPWRLLEGEALYRDIAYRNGPLSPSWNALLFAVFGVSLRTLVVANLALLATFTALLFRLLERATSPRGAWVGTAVLLATCGFGQYGSVGNYNFVTPYQHGQTHGLLLGLILVALLARSLDSAASAPSADSADSAVPGRGRRWLAAGIVLGAVGLTKAELFVPALGVAACAAALELARRGRPAWSSVGALAGGAAIPAAVALAALASAMPLARAAHGLLGNWPYLGQALFHDAFYAAGAGLDAPLSQLAEMLGAVAALAAAAAVLLGCERWATGRARPALWTHALAVATGAAVGVALDVPWSELARALPVALVLAIGRWLPPARRGEPGSRLALLLAVWSLALLAKLGLHPQVQHYGFALAAPALALSVAVGVSFWRTAAAAGLAVAIAAAFASAHLAASSSLYADKTARLGSGADAIRVARPEVSPRGTAIERTLRGLDALMPPEASLLVMPEGVGLNYWLRRANPTPYSLFLPTEQAAHGGAAAMLEAMTAEPPDFVVLVHRGHREFGTGPFLQDPLNGAAFAPWLASDYERIQRIGAEPFEGPGFGIVILRRTAEPPPVSR